MEDKNSIENRLEDNGEEEEDELEVTETNVQDLETQAKQSKKEGDLTKALQIYSAILEYKAKRYGETGLECAQTYYEYGLCLLAHARKEFDVLGTALKKNMETQLKNNIPSLASSTNEESAAKGKFISTNDPVLDEDEDEEEEGQPVTIESAQETLENAWEVLELARVIYSNHPEKKLDLAEVYLTLGDLDMESDNMDQAVHDFAQCLKLREEVLSTDDRRLAEVHYSLGLAENFVNHPKEALLHFISAKKVLEAALVKLLGTPSASAQDEINEIKEILVELNAKIEEFREPAPKIVLKQETPASANGFSKPTLTEAPVQVLGVRKKEVNQPQPQQTLQDDGKFSGSKRKSELIAPESKENIAK